MIQQMNNSKHSHKKAMLIALLLVVLLMAPCQWAAAQVSLNMGNTTLRTVINKIQKQTKTRFFYDDKVAKISIRSIKVKNVSLESALQKALEGTGVTYTRESNIVYLKQQPQEPKVNYEQPKTTQKKKITGQILDENGEPLIGATIAVKGTNEKAVTDVDGNYSILSDATAPVLTFSYLGYKDKEVAAKNQNVVNVSMDANSQDIDEVVVTALGIKREKKMLGYAVQDIKSDALNTTGDPSVTSALAGKVAGLQMNTASTGLGGSTKITIRGNSSLTDNNQPLWVVDGVPFTDNQTSDASTYGGYDRGGTSFDINPEDIESISVLKGANAAALYGSRAGNGVIYVTTKKGSHKQGFGVSYSGNFTWSTVSETIKMQKKYGQGSQGQTVYTTDESGNKKLSSELSFGSALDGHLEPSFLGEEIPYSYYGDKLKDYFKTGFSQFHTVAIGNATDKSHFRTSVGYNDNRGLFKGEKLDKLSIDMNAGAEINKYLSMDGKISLSRMKAENRPMTGLSGEVGQLLLIPGNVRLQDLQQYTTTQRMHQNWFGPDMQYSNPYYVRHQYQNSDERWRAFGYYSANLNFTDWLKFTAKYAFDYYRTRIQSSNLSLGNTAVSTDKQNWSEMVTEDNMNRSEENYFEHNISFMFMGDKQLSEDFRLGYNLGSNIMYQKYETLGASVRNMLEKDNWIFNTGAQLTSANDDGHERSMYSAFGSLQLAFREYLSLDLTARNDWSSTLPKHNRSFFYPSASVSYVFSDFMRSIQHPLPAWITFAKTRLSLAQVGKDPDPYNLYNTRVFIYSNAVRQPVVQTVKKNENLKPEIKTSFEWGLDMKFFDNRLGFDFTYYNTKTKNQAMLVDASAPWTQQWVNAGKITNKGIELMLYATPVKTRDFNFDLTMNFAKNTSRVDELAEGVSRVYFSGDSNMPVKVGAKAGGKLGDIYANNLIKRDANGNMVIGTNGLPLPVTSSDAGGNLEQYILDHPIGNIEPKLLMSITPSFTYKGINLTAMFDMRFGGDIVSVSEGMATAVGTSAYTEYRGEYKTVDGVADYYMVVPGVTEDGQQNTKEVSAQAYYSNIGLYKSQKGYAELFVHSASYIKLKELSMGYSFPQALLKRTPFTNLKLSFVARNLCFLLKHTPGNPDGGYDTSMFSQALDFAAVPYTRTFGFSINVGF
jgi:TonB-linked SusC/RagA family outer membrane protein